MTRHRIYEIIEKSKKGDKASAFFDWLIIILICLNIAAVIIESFDTIHIQYSTYFQFFEYFSVIIFTIEYLLRIWTAPYKYPSLNKSWISYLRFIISFMGIVDLCAILPFYLPFIINVNLRYLRIFRLFRLLRVLKINRYNDSLTVIGRVLKKEKEKLVVSLFILFILILLASSLMYQIENSVQPEQFPNIPSTLWWAVSTLSTVGYGDVYPITPIGKVLGGIISILGIGLIALPSGIISSGLINDTGKKIKSKSRRRHHGKW